jgi:hypothetical protein
MERKCLEEKELWLIFHAEDLGETKPMPRSRITDWGRPAAGRLPRALPPPARARRPCETNPIWSRLGRAKPPTGERCQTNPIFPLRAGTPLGPIARNKPNLARPGRGRRPGGRTVRNEPNLVAVQGPGGRNTQNEPNFGGTSHRSWSEDLLRGGWAGRLFRRRPVGNIDPRP